MGALCAPLWAQLHSSVLVLEFRSHLGLVFPCYLPTFPTFQSGNALHAVNSLETCSLAFGFYKGPTVVFAEHLTLNFGRGPSCYVETVTTPAAFGDDWINLVFRDSQEPLGSKWNTLA